MANPTVRKSKRSSSLLNVERIMSQTLEATALPASSHRHHSSRCPSFSIKDGETCCCSGCCIEVPCLDRYAPNATGRCMVPRYDDELYDFKGFFDEVVPRLRTGDVVLCSWPLEGQFGTQISRCMSHSRWSHVGTVYRPSDCPSILKHKDCIFPDEVHPSRPLLLHTIAAGECGSRRAPEKGGIDIVDLEVWLKDYLDKFSHCHLDVAEDPSQIGDHIIGIRHLLTQRDEAFYHGIESTLVKFFDTPFEHSTTTFNVMVSQIDLFQHVPCCRFLLAEQDLSELFCSELRAELDKASGIISQRLNSSEMVPAMWDTTRQLQLTNGSYLSKEYVCRGPATLTERRAMGYPDREDHKERHDYSTCFGSGGFFGVDVSKLIDTSAMLPEKPKQAQMTGICCRRPFADHRD